jgi:hypothetical protein
MGFHMQPNAQPPPLPPERRPKGSFRYVMLRVFDDGDPGHAMLDGSGRTQGKPLRDSARSSGVTRGPSPTNGAKEFAVSLKPYARRDPDRTRVRVTFINGLDFRDIPPADSAAFDDSVTPSDSAASYDSG